MNKQLLIQGLELMLKALRDEPEVEPMRRPSVFTSMKPVPVKHSDNVFKPTHIYIGNQKYRSGEHCSVERDVDIDYIYKVTFECGLSLNTEVAYIRELDQPTNQPK